MSTEPIDNDTENKEDHNNDHIPFDGFVNVNDIVEKRRSLRSVDLQTPDPAVDVLV